jgi:endogenous inhibitor of DNA gyrase (YacG/DUF329 family)
MRIETECSECGKKLVLYRYGKQINYFCNSSCYGLWQKGRLFLPERLKIHIASRVHGSPNTKCDYCGKKFHRHPSAIHPKNFCCQNHKNKYHWPERGKIFRCILCGKEFRPHRKSAKYCSFKCMGLANRKPFIIKNGYKKILNPIHPRADAKGYVFEHIIVLEEKLGRPLQPGEESHHIDGNKLNNFPDNLDACINHFEHMKNHPHRYISK